MRKKTRGNRVVLAVVVCLLAGFAAGMWVGRSLGIPLFDRGREWSIGIFVGSSPLRLRGPDGIGNPVMTAGDVTDCSASFVADPFLVQEEGLWHLFFQVKNEETNQGDIGLATSRDGKKWNYDRIVLDEPFHLSYPYVFEWEDDHYMIPESYQARSIRLYRADEFPTSWSLVKILIEDEEFVDPSILRHGGKWWLFTTSQGRYDLHLFKADDLTGPWTSHRASPIIKNDLVAGLSGGRVIQWEDKLYRFSQECSPVCGYAVRAFEIEALTDTTYSESEVEGNPILEGSGSGWNAQRMHHIDPQRIEGGQWIAAVDGCKEVIRFGFWR